MTLVGFKRMTVRVLDKDTPAVDKNLFTIEGKESKGATQKADIKGLAPETTKAFGSNITYFISNKGVGDVTVDLEILDLPFAVREVLLGYEKSGAIGFVGAGTEAPYSSVLLESEDLAGNKVFLGFFKGIFKSEEMSMETRQEKTPELASDKLTFAAMASDADGHEGRYMAYYIGKDEAEITKIKTALGMAAAA